MTLEFKTFCSILEGSYNYQVAIIPNKIVILLLFRINHLPAAKSVLDRFIQTLNLHPNWFWMEVEMRLFLPKSKFSIFSKNDNPTVWAAPVMRRCFEAQRCNVGFWEPGKADADHLTTILFPLTITQSPHCRWRRKLSQCETWTAALALVVPVNTLFTPARSKITSTEFLSQDKNDKEEENIILVQSAPSC